MVPLLDHKNLQGADRRSQQLTFLWTIHKNMVAYLLPRMNSLEELNNDTPNTQPSMSMLKRQMPSIHDYVICFIGKSHDDV